MQLIVEIGNTHIKLAVFKGDELVKLFVELSTKIDISVLSPYTFDYAIIAGSGNANLFPWQNIVAQHKIKFSSELLPHFSLNYDTPATLGQDRIINTYYASQLFPHQPNLVIDMGTCLTFSLVDEGGIFQGGSISSGLQMRAKSLHHYTARLPLIEVSSPPQTISPIGKSTEGSILSGVSLGMKYEIDARIDAYSAIYPNLNIIITGGDSPFYENNRNYKIFADPNFTLRGLNYIVLHNA